MTRQQLGSLAGIAIGLAGIGFVAIRVTRDWDQVTGVFADADVRWVVLAFVGGVAAMSVIADNWVALLRRRDESVVRAKGYAWFFVGQLGKYVPGGIWPVVGQAELAVRGGMIRRNAYAATATSMVATLTGAAAFASVTGLATGTDGRLIAIVIGVAMAAVIGVLANEPGRRRLERAVATVLRRPLALPTGRFLAIQTLRHVPVWVFFGAMNLAVVVALDGMPPMRIVVEVVFATALSWMAGFVVVGLPGGIGVREAVWISAMTGPLGAGVALSAAITSRIVSVTVDVVAAAVGPLVATLAD